MRTLGSHVRRLRVALAVVALLVVAGSPPTMADSGQVKTYTVDVDGTAASGVYAGDTDATIDVTFANLSAQQSLGSANVTVPAPLVVAAVDGVPYAGGAVVELREIGLAPGASRTFVLTVDVQTCVAAAPAEVAVVAKQSNDFQGTGNDFTLVAPGSDTSVDVVGACRPAFVDPPADAERTETITSVAFDPGGAPITLELRDAGDTGPASAATGATLTLTAARPGADPAPGLGGTTSAATVGGVASFAPTLSVSASGYTFTASGAGLDDSVPSDAFDVVDGRADCAADAGCSTSANKNGQTVTASLAGGPGSGNLLLSLDAGDAPDFECADYPHFGQVVSQFLFDGGDGRVATFTQTIPGGTRPLKDFQVCWAAPYEFVTKRNTTAEVQGVKPGTSDPLWVGLLPDCTKGATNKPCVSVRKMDNKTKVVTLTVLATSADPWRYN